MGRRQMFNPENNRVDYGKILTPPEGYELDFAVGTTYSLDLDAFIGICMSIGLSADTESTLFDNPLFMLDVLHKTSDKIALFCEGGQIHFPSKITQLYSLLENSVYQISVKKTKTAYPSFHPKFWLISYVNDKGLKEYRVIVLSRNLTFDRSWDVAITLDGEKRGEITDKNKPVKDFLSFLSDDIRSKHIGKNKIKKIQELISELDFIKFETEEKGFENFDFIPLGIGDYSIKDYPLFGKEQYYELLVMSPFLSKETIKDLNSRWRKSEVRPLLFTRKESISGYSLEDCGNFDVYCMRDEVVDGDTEEENRKQQDIHAKLYMLRLNSKIDTELYLGSMNCSHNAMNGNIEFMIRLTCKRDYLNLKKLKQDLFCGDEGGAQNPFEKVNVQNIKIDTEEDENLDRVIKAICRSKAFAQVEQYGDNYNIVLQIKCKAQPYPVMISPLFVNDEQPLSENIVFSGLSLKNLSRFYKLSVKGKNKTVQRVIVIPTSGIPENRDDAVISSIVPDTKSFYAYVSFVLGDNPVLGAMDAFRVLENADGSANTINKIVNAALYEKMLKVAATNPEKLHGIDYLMKAVSNDGIIPEDFIKLYETFQRAVKK